ncbi:hypothetical protein HOP50_09g54110 [Chloropicon primus]|uniref:Uncharacterized protein n=1 Tax=Chloropicon primus TaxID=1764295 RepID=A0A5B8MR09_9CHLO|nr:hypothetical protein A3770_09p53810 [Chloropicon primus]UPR02087.1 hypothetical protein HOP50_09g54110 [Chloropicon primus]|eukprot:QDZ22863.1 hypothetical protein A3770_09p53810 [Chloropicon primus]
MSGDLEMGSGSGGVGARAGAAVVSLRKAAFQNVLKSQPLTRSLAGLVLIGFVLQLLVGDAFRNLFALVPAKVIPKLWMLITAGLVEVNPLQLLVNVGCLFFVGNLLEPLWGWKELAKFLVFVNALGFSLVMATYILIYIFARTVTVPSSPMIFAQFGGFTTSVGGLFVGLKQALPEEELSAGPGYASLRFKNLPLVYLVLCLVVTGVFEDGSIFFMALYGILTAFIYLRKFHKRPDSTTLGDQSESMRLISLFPEAVHPALEVVSTEITKKIFSGKGGRGTRAGSLGSGDLPTTTPENPEAARRRERGAAALEKRLENMAQSSTKKEKGGGDE